MNPPLPALWDWRFPLAGLNTELWEHLAFPLTTAWHELELPEFPALRKENRPSGEAPAAQGCGRVLEVPVAAPFSASPVKGQKLLVEGVSVAPRTEGCLDTEGLDWLGHMFHFCNEIFWLFCSSSAELTLLSALDWVSGSWVSA